MKNNFVKCKKRVYLSRLNKTLHYEQGRINRKDF